MCLCVSRYQIKIYMHTPKKRWFEESVCNTNYLLYTVLKKI